ncbi:hypothetical protein cypCar_00041220, partial [Cyprinus carpio]
MNITAKERDLPVIMGMKDVVTEGDALQDTCLVSQFKGDSEKQTGPLGITLGVTIPLICILVLVIILLLRREHKRNSELKKKKECLTPVDEVTSAAGDHS